MRLDDYYDAMARHRMRHYQAAGGLSSVLQGIVQSHTHRCVRRALASAESVADIGCGFGAYLVGLDHLRRLFLNDLSAAMIDSTKARVVDQFPNVSLSSRTGSLLDIPVDEIGTYQLVLSIGVVNHLQDPDLEAFLARLARLSSDRILLGYAHEGFLLASGVGTSLRKRGLHYRHHTRKAIRSLMAEKGFRSARASYTFAIPLVSPLVMEEFRREV